MWTAWKRRRLRIAIENFLGADVAPTHCARRPTEIAVPTLAPSAPFYLKRERSVICRRARRLQSSLASSAPFFFEAERVVICRRARQLRAGARRHRVGTSRSVGRCHSWVGVSTAPLSIVGQKKEGAARPIF